jgi:hypothetical protein
LENSLDRAKQLILWLAFVSPLWLTSVRANPEENLQQQCRATTQSVVEEIGSFGTPVYLGKSNEANTRHSGNPTGRATVLSIILGNLLPEVKLYTLVYPFPNQQPRQVEQTVENILNSLALQQKWSNSLAQDCPDLAVVIFGLANTDWTLEHSIQSNGTMRLRDCSESNDYVGILPWNQRFCY